MGQRKLLARFADFSGGEFGTVAARRAPANAFTGKNVVVYPDGSIGPRGGIKDLAVTGAPAGSGAPTALVMVGSYLVMALANLKVYKVLVAASSGMLATAQPVVEQVPVGTAPSTVSDMTAVGLDRIYAAAANGVFLVVPSGNVATLVAGSPVCTAITQWGDFLVTANGNRLQWSAPANFNSWPATNFLDIGGNEPGSEDIGAMVLVRDTLVVITDAGSIFIVSGTLGVNHSLREWLPGERTSGLVSNAGMALDRSGILWYTRMGALATALPVSFSGAQRGDVSAQDGWLRGDTVVTGVARTRVSSVQELQTVAIQAALWIAGNENMRFLTLRRGVWTRHESSALQMGYTTASCPLTAGPGGNVILGRWDGAALKMYGWNVEQDAPPTTATFSGVGDGSDTAPSCEFTTAEVTMDEGGEFLVDTVDVAFTKVATGAAQTNHFDIDVNAFDAYEDTSPAVPTTQSFDEATAAGRQRKRFQFAPRPGRAFSVKLSNLRGVKVDEILVFGNRQESRL